MTTLTLKNNVFLSSLHLIRDESTTTNQLIEACKIYIESELFYTELETFTYFNYHVTFPFLNAI